MHEIGGVSYERTENKNRVGTDRRISEKIYRILLPQGVGKAESAD